MFSNFLLAAPNGVMQKWGGVAYSLIRAFINRLLKRQEKNMKGFG